MKSSIRFLNANAIKILALLTMVVDHIGFMFFPTQAIWRIIGRISFPLFAFCIAEGCRYTKNKYKYFFMVFGLGVFCQLFFFFFSPEEAAYLNVLFTFSLGMLTVYAMQYLKRCIFEDAKPSRLIPACLVFLLTLAFTATVCNLPFLTIDYGFWGCMFPVFVSLFDFKGIDAGEKIKKLDCLYLRIFCLGVAIAGLAFLGQIKNPLAPWAFLSLPILCLYNEQKGKWKMKYFFYIFYPLHFAILEGIYMLVYFF